MDWVIRLARTACAAYFDLRARRSFKIHLMDIFALLSYARFQQVGMDV